MRNGYRPRHHFRRPHGSGPPPFVRRMGCVFFLIIVLTVLAVKALSSFASTTTGVAVAVGVGIFIVLGIVLTISRLAQEFGQQVSLRRQLMADVAHELRTPLAILQGRVEGLIDGVYPRDDAHLEELLAETKHLSRLVEDVRTLANAEAGALDLQLEEIDIAELTRDTASALDSSIAVTAPEELHVRADGVRIREVLLNLLSNAKQHAPAGRVSVSLESRGGEVVIRVRDDGPGIPREELPRLFQRYQKGRDSRGTGLGLAIARRLVLAHGGTIDVESAEGAGTTVTVTLRRSSPAARE